MGNLEYSLADMMMAELDVVKHAELYVGQTIYNNQAATIRAICNRERRKVIAIHARQTGKTNSVATSCAILGEKYDAEEFGNILIFGPREGQAGLDVQRLKSLTQFNPHYADVIDWQASTKTVVKFKDKKVGKFSWKPGIFVQALSGAESANIEGSSAGLIIIEECQKVSDKVVSEVILPMGGAWDAKIVKIGTPRHRNNFWLSSKDPTYTKCIFPWTECDILTRKGAIPIDGMPTSRYVLERMPLVIKQQYWPDNPVIDYEGDFMHVWDIPGDMTPDDFRTQYMLEWLLDVDLFLSEEELELLYGDHEIEDSSGYTTAQYFAGLDIAGGSLTDPHDGGRNDFTAITVIKKYPDGNKQVVYKDERYGTNYMEQIEWIREVCSTMFPATAIFADATGCGMPVIDVLRSMMPKTSIVGVMFSRTEPKSGKNWKNALFDNIKTEITTGRYKYPSKQVVQGHQLFSKHLGEWGNLECKRTTGINKIIRAPGEEHDDGPCSEALAAFIADNLSYVCKTLKQGRGRRAVAPILTRGLAR